MEAILSVTRKRSVFFEMLKDICLVSLGSMLIAVSAPFTIPLSFSVVPLALQMNVAFLVAYLLGPRRGPAAVMLFLLQGLAGLPVFAGGAFGIAAFVGPRGGYLVGYLIASIVMASFRPKSLMQVFRMFVAGNVVVYCLGFMWLSLFIGVFKAFTLGILPFIVGDFIKLLCISRLSFFNFIIKSDSSR